MSEEKKQRGSGFRPFGFITGKIRNKLLIIMMAIAFGTLVVGAFSLYTMRLDQEALERDEEYYDKIKHHVAVGHQNILLAKDAAQLFVMNAAKIGFENARAEYTNKVASYLDETQEGLAIIQQMMADDQKVANQMHTVNINVQALRNAVANIVTLTHTRGVEDQGLIGILEMYHNDFASLVKGQPKLSLIEEKVGSQRKDYLINPKRKVITAINESFAEMKKEVLNSPLPPETKKKRC